MFKSVLKEVCIMLLLCAAIVLILGVIFYDYIPANKTVPNKIGAYSTPENIQQEIETQIVETEKETVTYTITGSDLNLYKQTNSFVPGKADPFAASTSTNDIVEGGGDGSQTSGGGASGGTTQEADPNSTGTFFDDMGLK